MRLLIEFVYCELHTVFFEGGEEWFVDVDVLTGGEEDVAVEFGRVDEETQLDSLAVLLLFLLADSLGEFGSVFGDEVEGDAADELSAELFQGVDCSDVEADVAGAVGLVAAAH